MKSTIVNNKGNGINVMGESCKVILQDNKICFNKKDGVLIGTSVEAFCLRNDVIQNLNGFKLVNCEARLVNNKIQMNLNNGVYSMSVDSLLNNSEIKMN